MVELIKIGDRWSLEKELAEKGIASFEQGILLNTCNRAEWYSGSGKISDEIVKHLFRVVSGLDSPIIGETAIAGQVKQAYLEAASKIDLNKSLHKLFQKALYVGKRVRNETGISRGAMSYSQAVVNILFKHLVDAQHANITIIGVNSLNESIIRFLVKKGASTIFIGNRTFEKAKLLAEKYNVTALQFDSLSAVLQKTDILISATRAPHYVVKKENFCVGRKMYIIDLAASKDVDPDLGKLPDVKLFDIGDIENYVLQNVQMRMEKIVQAEEIIENEVQIFSKNVTL